MLWVDSFKEKLAKGNVKEAKRLINEHILGLNTKNDMELTALSYAVIGGYTELVQMLIKMGANIDATDRDGRNSFMYANICGQEEVVKELLKNKLDINQKDNYGLTALMYAVKKGYTKLVRILLDNGANFYVKDINGKSALTYAKENGRSDIEQILSNYDRLKELKIEYEIGQDEKNIYNIVNQFLKHKGFEQKVKVGQVKSISVLFKKDVYKIIVRGNRTKDVKYIYNPKTYKFKQINKIKVISKDTITKKVRRLIKKIYNFLVMKKTIYKKLEKIKKDKVKNDMSL